MALISLKDWAIKNGITPDTARQKALRGNLPAQKIGREWLIEEDTVNIDNRITSQKYASEKQWIVSCDLLRPIKNDDEPEKKLPPNALIFCGRARVFVSAVSVQEAISKGKELLIKDAPEGCKISTNKIGASLDCDKSRALTDKYYTVK